MNPDSPARAGLSGLAAPDNRFLRAVAKREDVFHAVGFLMNETGLKTEKFWAKAR
jgi:hypothetical protein